MRLQQSEDQYLDFVYTLPEDEYMMDFDVRVVGMRNGLHPESLTNFRFNWEQKIRQQEKVGHSKIAILVFTISMINKMMEGLVNQKMTRKNFQIL